jgi:heat shock protein HslJ
MNQETKEIIMAVRKIIALSLFAVVLLSACAPSGGELAGTEWRLISLDGNTQIGEAIGGRAITLVFEDNEAGGSAGCNSYGGNYTSGAGDISFSQLISTLMACEGEGIMEAEQAFLAALNAADRYELSDSGLTISGGGHTLVFSRM